MVDARILLPVILLVATTVYLVAAQDIANPYADRGGIGPSFFPIVIAVAMYAALIAVLIDGVRAVRAGEPPFEHRLKDPAKVVLLTAVYVALFRPLGFLLATTAYVTGLFHVFDLGTRNPVKQVAVALVIALLGHLLFRTAFGVRLPTVLGLDLPL